MTAPEPPVVIRVSVEDMIGCVENTEIERAKWDALRPWQRRQLLRSTGHDEVNNLGGYGVDIESGAPDGDLNDAPGESFLDLVSDYGEARDRRDYLAAGRFYEEIIHRAGAAGGEL